MKPICLHCRQPLANKRGGAKFCSLECKNAYNYIHRSPSHNLSGSNTIEPPKPSPPLLQLSGPGPELLSNPQADLSSDLANTLEVNGGPEEKEEPPEHGGTSNGNGVEKPLPAQYLTTFVQKPSLRKMFWRLQLNGYESDKTRLEEEFKKLTEDLKAQQRRNGSDLVAGGTLGGAMLSLKLSEKSNGWERLFYIGAGLLAGRGLGKLARSLNSESLEADKKRKITAIQNRMQQIREEYILVLQNIKDLKYRIAKEPEYLTHEEKTLNPEYEKALRLRETLQGPNKLIASNHSPKEWKFRSEKILKASEVGKMKYKALNFQDLWGEFYGLPSVNFRLLMHGNSGEGKSTFAMWMGRYLAINFGRVLYVCAEEGINLTFHQKLVDCKAEIENFYVLDVRTGDEFMNEVDQNDFHFIILDSLHDMGIDAKKMKEIFQAYPKTAFICIDQNNKKGELLGANEKLHICDIAVNVKNYIAQTTKNRFKQKGMIFNTLDFTKAGKSKIIPLNPDKGNDYDLDSDRKNSI